MKDMYSKKAVKRKCIQGRLFKGYVFKEGCLNEMGLRKAD